MNPSRIRSIVLATLASALLLPLVHGCAKQPLTTASGTSRTDAKFTLSAYRQEGDLYALIVDSKLTRLRADREYVPVEVAVVNKGLAGITLTSESFTLVDESGRRYPTVQFRELSEGYGNTDVDRRLSDLRSSIAGAYQSYTPLRSSLTRSFDNPVTPTVKLPRFHYVRDFIYFPRPEGGVKGRRFDLLFEAPELPESAVITFEVAGKPDDADR